MKERDKLIKETNKLIKFYADKNSPIKNYLRVVHDYFLKVDTLQLQNIFEEITERQKSEMFIDLLKYCSDVELNNFYSICRSGLIIPFDIDFMEWFYKKKKELKRKLKWSEIVELNYKYGLLQIEFIGKYDDFNTEIAKNIKISEIWNA